MWGPVNIVGHGYIHSKPHFHSVSFQLVFTDMEWQSRDCTISTYKNRRIKKSNI